MSKCPLCFSEIGTWTDDPILTPDGVAGINYKGFTYMKLIHITELQNERIQQEIDAGIPEGERTVFSPVVINKDFYRHHIEELRESTEKILNKTGQTKDEYFNYDEDGEEHNIGNHQTDWIDVDLTGIKWIKARHIEDLRHYLLTIPIPVIPIAEIKGTVDFYYEVLPTITWLRIKTTCAPEGWKVGCKYYLDTSTSSYTQDLCPSLDFNRHVLITEISNKLPLTDIINTDNPYYPYGSFYLGKVEDPSEPGNYAWVWVEWEKL